MLTQLLQLLLAGVAQGCVYALVALGFVLIYKATETVNFAQGDLMMLGAFFALTASVILGWPYWATIVFAVVVMAAAAEKAGPNLTPVTLDKALESLTYPRDMFGGDEQTFGPKKHLGSNRAKLCQIQSGKWVSTTDYITD